MGSNRVYQIDAKTKAFASYGKGLVYIGDMTFLDNLDEVKDDDILILDERIGNDPNMKILSSYIIKNRKDKKEILKILSLYEKKSPSEWNRSYESMMVEWEMHNLLHSLGYRINRTTDVDLNNNDEHFYDDAILKKIFRL